MRQSKRNKSSFYSAPLLGAFLLLLSLSSAQTNQCNPAFTSTVNDGFLDTNLNYAQFSRDLNSSLRFQNPFQLLQPQPTQGSVMMWFRNQRTDGLFTQGRLFDCGDSIMARLVGTNLTVSFTQNIILPNGTWTSNVTRQSLNTPLNVSSQFLLASWNHLAVSVKNQRLNVFFNGQIVGGMNLANTSFAVTTASCTIGNGWNVTDPLNGQIRHLVFSNTGYTNNTQDMQSIKQIMRSVFLPNDPTVLAYFKFDKYSMFFDSYLYNTTRMVTATNVTLQNASEPEQACYCPYQANPVLSVSQNSPLQPIPLFQSNSNTAVQLDANGVTIKFWAYLRLNNRNDSIQVPDTVIVSLQNYSDIVIVNNNVTSMRVDLYTTQDEGQSFQATPIFLPGFSPVYNTWVQYEVQIGSSQVALFVNGLSVASVPNSITLQLVSLSNLSLAILPAYSLPTSIPGPNQIQMLLTSLSLYQNLQSPMTLPEPSPNSPLFLKIGQTLIPGQYPSLDPQTLSTFYTSLASFTFTLDQLQTQNQTQFLSAVSSLQWIGNFSFEQINQDFCNPGEVFGYFDGISCQNTKQAANFQTSNQPTFISGLMRSFTPGNLSIDLWFKPTFNSSDPTLNATGFLFQNYDQFNNPLVSISYGIQTGIVYCSLQNQTVQTDPTQVNVTSGQWYHVACVFNSVNGTVYIYNQQSTPNQYNATAPMIGQYQAPMFPNTQYLTYIGNNMTGAAQAQALIKEVRVFNYSLAQAELNFVRFVKNNKQSLIDNGLLIGQIQLSTGYQGYYLNNSVDRSLFLTNSNPNGQGVSWQLANDLTVCPPNTIFDGQCCNSYPPENLSVSFLYNETQNVNVVLTAVVNNQPLPMQSMSFFNWTVTRVLSSNPLDFGTNIARAIIQAYINTNVQGQSQITLPYNLFNFAYNYQFTVAVDTIVSSRPTAVLYNFSLPCPRGFILNMTNPIVQQAGFERNLILQSQYFNSCYGLSGLTVRSVRWTSNVTALNLFPSQTTFYTQSSDNQTLNFTNNVPNNTFARLNYTVIFSNNQTFNDSRTIQFLGQTIILNISNLSSDGKIYLPQGSDLIININNTQFLATTIGRNEYQFNITCPSTLTSQCSFNQTTGIFRVPFANLITPIPQFDYSFNITVGRNGSLRAVAFRTIQVTWINPPIPGQKCPGTLINQANSTAGLIFRPNINTFSYAPYFVYDCIDNSGNTLPFRRLNISYTINNDQVQQFNAQNSYTLNLSSNFSDTFTLINNSLQFVFRNQSVTQIFRPGDIIPINITTVLQSRNNPLLISTDTTLFNITIANTPIQINQTSNIQTNASGIIPILFEQDFTMIANQSFDPDYSNFNVVPNILNSSVLSYQYTCNGVPCVLNPSQISVGSMTITTLDRIRLNLPFNQPIVFQIIASNPLAPLKPPQIATFTTSIALPVPAGLSQCPSPLIQSNAPQDSFNNEILNAFYFTIANATNLQLNFSAVTNCNFQQSYQNNFIMFQTFTPNLTSDGNVLYYYNPQAASVSIPAANLINQIPVNTNLTVQATLLFNTTIPNNSFNATGPIRTGLNYSTALYTIIRSYSNLVPQLRANYTAIQTQSSGVEIYNVGNQENIFFDASLSYDPDNVPQPFSYQYNCSQNIDPNWCASIQNQPNFTMTKQQRVNMSQNIPGQQFQVNLTLVQEGRISNVFEIFIIVTRQNYSRCFTVYDYQTQITVQSLSQLVNPIMIQPKIAYFCDVNNLIIDGFNWSSPQTSFPFWTSFSVPAGPNDFVIGITPQSLFQFGQNSVVNIVAGANFISFLPNGNNITTSFQNLISYQINITNGPPSIVINTASQLNLANGSPLIVSAYGVQNNQQIDQQNSCYYECLIAGNWIPFCSNTTNCSFDLYPIASQYQTQLLTPGATASVYVVLTGSSFSGINRLALNFVNLVQPQQGQRRMLQSLDQQDNSTVSSDNSTVSSDNSTVSSDNSTVSQDNSTDQSGSIQTSPQTDGSDNTTQTNQSDVNNGSSNSSNVTIDPSPPQPVATYPPLCQVTAIQNQQFLQDLQTTFQVFCFNYQSNQTTYQWSVNVITAGSSNSSSLNNAFTSGNQFQSVKVAPNTFVYSQNQYYLVSVIVTNVTDNTQFSTASIIVLGFNNLNINPGTITVSPMLAKMVNAYMTQFQIAFSGQSDANNGVLFNTIAFSYQGINTTLVTKTINQTFNVYLPANIDSITVSTYDQQGALVQTTIPMGLYAADNSQNWSYDDYNGYLNSTIIPYLNWSSSYLVRFYPQDLEAASFALQTANNVLNNIQNNPNLGGISGFQSIIAAQAINYLWNYTNSSVSARRSVLVDSLLANLQILNSCFNNQLAQQIVPFVYAININDWASSINPNVQLPISNAYTQLLNQLYSSTVLQPNDQAYIQSILQDDQSAQLSQMIVGDSLTLNQDGSTVTKINPLEWPANQPIQTSSQNVQLTLDPSVLSQLPISDGFVRIAPIQNPTLPPQSQNLTLYSNVVEIGFTDTNLNYVNVSGIPLNANITFTPRLNNLNNNISCGYYNPSTGQWLLESAAGLITTYNQATNVVNCQTNHFSQFSIFNQTYSPPPAPTPPAPSNVTVATDNSYTQRLIVSLIELGLVVLAFILFIIQCCSESSRKALYMAGDPESVTESFTFGRVFCAYSPLFSLCSPAYRLPFIIRLFVLLNFLLYISLYTLSNLAILDSNYRTVGDIVWLIASIVLVFLFSAPRLNHIFIYAHLKFSKASSFSNIGEAKSFETHRDEKQPIADAPMTPTAGNTPNFKLKTENHFDEDHEIQRPEHKEVKVGKPDHKENDMEDAYESNNLKNGLKKKDQIIDKKFVKSSTGDDDIHILGRDKPVMSPHTGVNVDRQTIQQNDFESDNSINNSDDHTAKNIGLYNQNENKSALKLHKGRDAGDSDHYEGGEREDDNQFSPNSKQQRNRRDRYVVEEPDTASGRVARRDGPSDKKRKQSSGEVVEANLISISILQLLALFVGTGLNAFLFSWVGINNVVQINAYFASLVISAALIIIVLDFLISIIAYLLFKSKGHKSSNCLSSLFVYGFIGLNRIRCLQQE